MPEEQCPHEEDVEYLELIQIDGEPQYNVKCKSCGKNGIIHLVEDEEEWDG